MSATLNGSRPLVLVPDSDWAEHRPAGVPSLGVGLLGGFRVERGGVERPVSAWQRRSAKTLTKLLATYPRHALHREQILEMLWADVDPESALNSFGKALYAARRAFEPELPPRQASAYLRLTDSMLALNTDHVAIDADRFQQLAESALRGEDLGAYEAALAAYGGELLPEDRYEDWCAERRDFLSGLHIRLLLGLSQALENRGAFGASIDPLREALQHDPTREDVHRRLMVLYAEMGSRDQAVRQYQLCHDVLRRELDLAPEKATVALFQDVLANRIPRRIPVPEPGREAIVSRRSPATERNLGTPFSGRDQVLQQLGEQLTRAHAGQGRLILLGGEAGVGKTRVVAELADEARRRGTSVLWGGSAAHATDLAYAPFAVALERYAVGRTDAERKDLVRRYPALVHLVPSLGMTGQPPPEQDHRADDPLYLMPAIVRLLSDLARTRPVVLVLGDLHDLQRSSLDLLRYLAHLVGERRWLIVGTFREECLEAGSDLWHLIETITREDLCLRVALERLARPDCDQLVRAMLAGGHVAGAALDHIYARSLGNPLFVEELVREMLGRSELVFADGSWRTSTSPSECVPPRVRSLVAMRVAPMPENVRRVLALAATASDTAVPLSALRAAAAALEPAVSDSALFDALDCALEARLLEEREDGYAFRHPLVRSALYEELSQHRRAQLHAALGRSAAEPSFVSA